MDPITAFLTLSGIAYFLCLPFKCTINLDIIPEKLLFIVSGCLILGSLYLYNNWLLHLALSIFYGFAALASWLGLSKWKFLDYEISPIHQIAMFVWDLLIALAFMTKI